MEPHVSTGRDGVVRCWWPGDDPLYVAYHDEEWGRPFGDDRTLFEKLSLEGFQAGLSWLTILRKRPAFRSGFYDFDPERVAAMTGADVARLLGDPRIVRHRGKIESVVNNANRLLELRDEWGSFGAFVWSYEPSDPPELRSISAESTAMARELKRRGFTFVGPTTAHAFMQAMGLINDHLEGCAARDAVADARRRFSRPERATLG